MHITELLGYLSMAVPDGGRLRADEGGGQVPRDAPGLRGSHTGNRSGKAPSSWRRPSGRNPRRSYYLLGGASAGGTQLVLARCAVDECVAEGALLDGLPRVDGDAPAADRLWMSACAGGALLGDGGGRAWWLPWAAAGWGKLRALDGTERDAVPLLKGGGRR